MPILEVYMNYVEIRGYSVNWKLYLKAIKFQYLLIINVLVDLFNL